MTTERDLMEHGERLHNAAGIAENLRRLGLSEQEATAGAVPGPDGHRQAEEVRGALGVYRRHRDHPTESDREAADAIDRNLSRLTG